MIGQPHEMATGPPLFHAWPNVVKQPARIEMIENEMAKLEKPDHGPGELLLVAELGQVLLVVGQLAFGMVSGFRHRAPSVRRTVDWPRQFGG